MVGFYKEATKLINYMFIKQLYVAGHGSFFKNGLVNRYGFQEYCNNIEPAMFFGVTGCEQLIDNHQGFKLVHAITPLDEENISKLKSENLHVFYGPHIKHNKNFVIKNVNIEFKDYSIFKPNQLGDKIYCYMRDKHEFNFNSVQRIQSKINFEIIFGGLGVQIDTYIPIETLKSNYYDNCFLNINLSQKHGFVTVRELGLMGRKTIMNTPYDFPSIIPFKNEDDIIELINRESLKIGTTQESINPHCDSDEWLQIEFWKN
jgi:hypothetical protein